MNNKDMKKWTILIYADGNNEMEEIMHKSFLACERIGSNSNVNVVIQIGKLGNYKTADKDNWSGVRRYYIENGYSTLIEDLGKTNLADPNVLYDFIKWGFENYTAEHFMLVLSDHGGDFIGCFTDLSLNIPYIMGIPEMIQAINAIQKNLGYIIDILVLDMCSMNCIEIIYELGQKENSTVKTALTYINHASYEGINYTNLLSTAENYSNLTNMNLFIKYLIDNQEFSLIAYEINHEKLEQIKLLFSYIARNVENPLNALNNITANEEVDFIKKINDKLKSIFIYSKKTFKGINKSITITSKDVDYLIVFYNKLAFSKNNFWIELLNKKPTKNLNVEKDKINVSLSPFSKPKIHYILQFDRLKP